MKNKLQLVFIIAISALVLTGTSSCQQETKRPLNFVFILVDDLGWADLSCYGSTFHETPNLDRLASESIRFTNAYASGSVCSPTRAAIMSGKNPVRVDITDWIPGSDPKNRPLLGPQDQNQLALREFTLAEAMGQNGYKTFFAGKWHLGNEGFFPEDQGFQINKGGHHKGSPPGGYYAPYKNPKLSDGPDGEYLPDRLTNESMQFIEENKDSAFFLFLSFYTVHTPIQASKRHLAKFEAKAKNLPNDGERIILPEGEGETLANQVRPDYASMVYAMDENVGRLLNKLDENGLSENTVVIFTSDNGGLSTLFPNRKAPTSVKPLRGGKGWLYEGGIRVPLIIRAPGITNPGESNVPVISHDFYPTILSLAGLPAMPEQHIDGHNLTPVLQGNALPERDALYWHYPHYHGSAWKPGSAIRLGNWKLVEFHETGKAELFNLENDLGEMTNLAEKQPEKVAELQQRLHEWQQKVGAKFAETNPGFDTE